MFCVLWLCAPASSGTPEQFLLQHTAHHKAGVVLWAFSGLSRVQSLTHLVASGFREWWKRFCGTPREQEHASSAFPLDPACCSSWVGRLVCIVGCECVSVLTLTRGSAACVCVRGWVGVSCPGPIHAPAQLQLGPTLHLLSVLQIMYTVGVCLHAQGQHT